MAQQHPNSKKITIFRAGSFIDDAQTQAQDFMALSKKSIGSYFASKSSKGIGSGLNFAEVDLLMPYVLDLPKEDRQFREKVRNFYASLLTKVEYGKGITLEIGLLEDNSKPVSATNLPIEIMDFIRYRHAIGHPRVAMSLADATGDQTMEFYIFDKAKVEDESVLLETAKEEAMAQFFAIRDKDDKVAMLLTVLKQDPRSFTGKNAANLRKTALKTLAENKPGEFLKQFRDKYFEERYTMLAMENTQILRKVGSQYIDNETSEILAHTEEEMLLFFKDKTKSQKIALLKGKLQEQMKNVVGAKVPDQLKKSDEEIAADVEVAVAK
mgnify:FL=1